MTAGWVALSFPRRRSVSDAVAADTAKASTEIMIEIASLIRPPLPSTGDDGLKRIPACPSDAAGEEPETLRHAKATGGLPLHAVVAVHVAFELARVGTKRELGRDLDVAIDLSRGAILEIRAGGAERPLDRAWTVADLGQADRGGEIALVRVRDLACGFLELAAAELSGLLKLLQSGALDAVLGGSLAAATRDLSHFGRVVERPDGRRGWALDFGRQLTGRRYVYGWNGRRFGSRGTAAAMRRWTVLGFTPIAAAMLAFAGYGWFSGSHQCLASCRSMFRSSGPTRIGGLEHWRSRRMEGQAVHPASIKGRVHLRSFRRRSV
jgi:hypothetical protein